MSRKRDYGSGAIEARGANSWRLRYRIGGRIFRKMVHGTKSEAAKALRQLLHAGDVGEHVDPSKLTLRSWAEHWLSIGAPGGKRRREVGARSLERYTELLHHVVAELGDRPLQQLQSTEIDALDERLEEKLAGTTLCNLHVVLAACIGTAFRTRKLSRNPMLELSKVPSRGEVDHGMVLEAEQLRALVQGIPENRRYTRSSACSRLAARGGTKPSRCNGATSTWRTRRCGSSVRSRRRSSTDSGSRVRRRRGASAPSRSTMI